MRIWLFRSNLRELEPYHKYLNLEEFEKECHDFYILQLIWFLRNNKFDEAVVWRLTPKVDQSDIVFDINGKKLIQKFVKDFSQCFIYPKPNVSFFRGGFPEYDRVVSSSPSFFGLKLYLAAGRRVNPKNKIYDKILVESEKDLRSASFIPFYKTANPLIFKPLNVERPKYDLIWICNFSQLRFKGQDFFFEKVSKSAFLKSLKILHIGNKRVIGSSVCKNMGIQNIRFGGYFTRPEVNLYLNHGKFGIVTSNTIDGCPRVSTEVMCSGTPLILREQTRLLKYYKDFGSVIPFNDSNLEEIVRYCIKNYQALKHKAIKNIDNLSMDKICTKNLDLWGI